MLKTDYKKIDTVQDLIDVLKDFDKFNKIYLDEEFGFIWVEKDPKTMVDITDLFINGQ